MLSILREDGNSIYFSKPHMIPVSEDILRYSKLADQVEHFIRYNSFEAAEMKVRMFKARECYDEFLGALYDRIKEAENVRLEATTK